MTQPTDRPHPSRPHPSRPPTSHTPTSRPWTSLRRALSWHRRKLGVLAAVVAVVATVAAASPPDPPATSVAVATASLPGGHAVTTDDLRMVRMPTRFVPEQAVTDPAALVGRSLVAPVTRGQVLTTVSVVRPRPDGAEDGLVTTPLRLADPDVVGLLAVGDVVDVIAADPRTGSSAVVAEQVRIVAIPRTADGGGPLGARAAAGEEGRLVLVAVGPEVATELASAAVSRRLTVAWG